MTQTPYRRREVIEGYLFAAPFLIGFVIFILFPMLWSLLLVFQKFNLFKPFVFNYVGLTNVNTALSDPKMWYSLWNTAYFAFLSVPLQLALAFLCAVLLNRPLRGSYSQRGVGLGGHCAATVALQSTIGKAGADLYAHVGDGHANGDLSGWLAECACRTARSSSN